MIVPDSALTRKARENAPISEKNLAGHELIGLKVEVVFSSDPTQRGISGKVIDETENLLVVKKEGLSEQGSNPKKKKKKKKKNTRTGKTVSVQKVGTTFRFTLPDNCESVCGQRRKQVKKVDIQGWTIHAKPEERTKRLLKLLRAKAPRK